MHRKHSSRYSDCSTHNSNHCLLEFIENEVFSFPCTCSTKQLTPQTFPINESLRLRANEAEFALGHLTWIPKKSQTNPTFLASIRLPRKLSAQLRKGFSIHLKHASAISDGRLGRLEDWEIQTKWSEQQWRNPPE